MIEDWFPHDDEGRESWCNNFMAEADAVAAALGIAKEEVAPLRQQAQDWLAAYDKVKKGKKDLAAAVKEQDEALKTLNDPLRKFVRQVKASPKATPQLLEDLRVVGAHSDPTARVDAAKPALGLHQGANCIEIDFTKHGHQGIILYGRRGTETAFAEVGRFSSKPAKDRRPNLLPGQAEHREYYAWYMERDEPVGSQGDTATIAAAAWPA